MVEQREHVRAVGSQEGHRRCDGVFRAIPGPSPRLRPIAAEPLVSVGVSGLDQCHLHAHRPACIIVYDVLDDLPDRPLPHTRLVELLPGQTRKRSFQFIGPQGIQGQLLLRRALHQGPQAAGAAARVLHVQHVPATSISTTPFRAG